MDSYQEHSNHYSHQAFQSNNAISKDFSQPQLPKLLNYDYFCLKIALAMSMDNSSDGNAYNLRMCTSLESSNLE
jgi:hypothetical protein